MKAAETIIAWTPDFCPGRERTRGQVRVGPLLQDGEDDWTLDYARTSGASFISWRKLQSWELIARLFIEFQGLVVSDGMGPQVVHRAFLTIDEYAQRISADQPGALPLPGDDELSELW